MTVPERSRTRRDRLVLLLRVGVSPASGRGGGWGGGAAVPDKRGTIMPVQVSYPGVYIDEQLSGSHAITPVSTSVTAFVGLTRRGRLGTPTRVTNLAQFQTLYGNDASMGELVPQVGQFFLNGGSTAWIT